MRRQREPMAAMGRVAEQILEAWAQTTILVSGRILERREDRIRSVEGTSDGNVSKTSKSAMPSAARRYRGR